jgi:hypothetical protein
MFIQAINILLKMLMKKGRLRECSIKCVKVKDKKNNFDL